MRAGAFDARRVAGVRLGFYFAANNVFPAGRESISWDQIFTFYFLLFTLPKTFYFSFFFLLFTSDDNLLNSDFVQDRFCSRMGMYFATM